MASAFALQCSNECSYALGASQFVEFTLTHERNETWNDDVNCGKTNLIVINWKIHFVITRCGTYQ